MKSYTEIPALQGIYLEDSWVLDIAAAPSKLVFTLDLVLTNDHPAHHPPRPGEQYCYERGTLEFTGISRLVWSSSAVCPTVDPSGETDYGNIDSFEWADDMAMMEGDWGRIEVTYTALNVLLDTAAQQDHVDARSMRMARFVRSVAILALPYEEQVAWLRSLGLGEPGYADELALELDEGMIGIHRFAVEGGMSPELRRATAELTGLITPYNGKGHDGFWSLAGLPASPQWHKIRTAALNVLRAIR